MATDPFFETVGTATRGASQAGVACYPASPPRSASEAMASARRWAQSDNRFIGVAETHERLPAGTYRCEMTDRGPALSRQQLSIDTLVPLPDSAGDGVVEEIRRFRGMREAFVRHGFLHKRGVLLWGPPGSGKSATVALLCSLIVEQEGGIAVLVDHPSIAAECLQLVRRIEPERPIVALFEDLDALVDRHGEMEFLALLDGEAQVDNIVFVATTNYPERLDKRFVDRPSRFDTIRFIGMPNRQAREVYLRAKAPELGTDLGLYVDATEGFSIAHLRELVILTQCFGASLEMATERLRGMRVTPDSGRIPGRLGPGFGGAAPDGEAA